MSIRTKTVNAIGLYTYPDSQGAPDGAMTDCVDMVVDRPGIVESARRWGVSTAVVALPSSTASGNSLDGIFALFAPENGSIYAIGCKTYTGVPLNLYRARGLFNITTGPTEYRTKNAALVAADPTRPLGCYSFNGKAYFNTASFAPYKEDSHSSGYMRYYGCGMPTALMPKDYTGTVAGVAAATVLPATTQVAYRTLLCSLDSNAQLIRGQPSGRLLVYNGAAGTYTYGLQVFLPHGQVFAGDIVQVYRSEQAATTSLFEPSDIMRQCYEYVVQAADVTAGYFVFNDLTIVAGDAARGAELYTNDTQQGILQAEARPPASNIAVTHKNVAWYAGAVNRPYRATFTILSVASWATGGSATTFTIGATTYTAANAETLASHQFKLFTAGTASQNIYNTARSLVNCINYLNADDYFATFTQSPSSLGATIIVENPAPTASYTITSANMPAATVAPTFPIAATAGYPVGNQNNCVYYSKPGQPEAVPDLNYILVGSPSGAIKWMMGVKDSLFIGKAEGLYRVTGTTASDIRVELFDATVRGGLQTSVCRADNALFSLCNKGMARITESGVDIVSRNIDDLILPWGGLVSSPAPGASGTSANPQFIAAAWSSELEKKVFLLLSNPSNSVFGTGGDQFLYTYNFASDTWVQKTTPLNSLFKPAMGGCSTYDIVPASGQASERVFVAQAADTSGSPTYLTPYEISSFVIPSPLYTASGTFTYTIQDAGDPGVLKRWYTLKLDTHDSTCTSLTVSFLSSASIVASTMTATVNSRSVTEIEVPIEHANSTLLTVQVTAPSSGRLIVHSATISFDGAGERVRSN